MENVQIIDFCEISASFHFLIDSVCLFLRRYSAYDCLSDSKN